MEQHDDESFFPPLRDEVTDIIENAGLVSADATSASLDFKNLMRRRINDILLVSSLYDFFTLVEDGQLTEAVFNEFVELKLFYAPHITRVNSGAAALELLSKRHFDLVITMQRLGDTGPAVFREAVRAVDPALPVVVMAYQSRELQLLMESGSMDVFDRVFIWLGDRRLILAIIKLYEDLLNAPSDCLELGVRSIILIEDSPSFYSSYLPLIYTELITQVQSLLTEGHNFSEKLLRQRARPKILHARSFEEAVEYYEKYRTTLLGVITDMEFPMEGVVAKDAGLRFISLVRKMDPQLPILLQSAVAEVEQLSAKFKVAVADKTSRTLFQQVSEFILEYFGFGDFVFRLPDGTEIQRARNLRELRDKLRFIPDESLVHHASQNHFSNWLMARTQFALARKLKPVKISQFPTVDGVRQYLIEAFTGELVGSLQGIITDFSSSDSGEIAFTRIGGGSLGGKARGLAFVDSLLKKYIEPDYFPGVEISIPKTVVLGTDVFSQFMEMNDLMQYAIQDVPDDYIVRRFVNADLPPTVLGNLRTILTRTTFPLAVRSSSLLEDAMYQPFAGIYATVMIPNSNPDLSVRFHNLTQAIKFVFASTFFKGAKNYIEATGSRIEEEKMGVLIQEVCGVQCEHYFYPHISGVARSFNYYPFGKAKQKDGVIQVALGLGKTIVDGGVSLQFSPSYPTVYPQFGNTRDLFYNSQVKFWAIDLRSDIIRKQPTEDQYMIELGIADAERQGMLTHICSTYSKENETLYEGMHMKGTRVLNFAPVLKSRVLPLTEILKLLLQVCETAMSCPVEIEFALRLGRHEAMPAEFDFLQVRPMVKMDSGTAGDVENVSAEDLLIKTDKALGNGVERFNDIVYVKSETFDILRTHKIAEELNVINSHLVGERKPYLLIGPGRWGSSDPSLGIPVKFPAISGAHAIVETSFEGMIVDPSQGSHFFQNLTSFRIMYFTVRHFDSRHFFDSGWLENLHVVKETKYVKHVRVEECVEAAVNGVNGKGVVLKRPRKH
jgi:hypothetical protein